MKIRLSDSQRSALECSSAYQDPETDRERTLLASLTDTHLIVTPGTADEVGFALVELANAEDTDATENTDPAMRQFARRAERSLSALARKAFRCSRG